MRRFFVFSVLLSLSFLADGSNSRTLDWYFQVSSRDSLPDFSGSVHPENQPLPWYSETQYPVVSASSYSVRLIYPVFQPLKAKELRSLRPYLKTFPDSVRVKVTVGMERKKPVLDLSFCPYIRKENTYFKLVSFDWEVKPVLSAPSRVSSHAAVRSVSTGSSVLASGKWKKISVTATGLYRLTYNDIKGMGINPDRVQVYGYGGAMLKEDFTVGGYVDDLPEVAVWKELGSDGIFNAGDFILFYAQGPVSWEYNNSYSMYMRVRNPYSDKAYYFVGERAEGTVMAEKSAYMGTPTVDVRSFSDFLIHETERVNIGESVSGKGTGRQLYGEDFTLTSSQTFGFDVPNPDTTQNAKALVSFIARNTGTSSCGVYLNGKWKGSLSISGISETNEDLYANCVNKVVSFVPSDETVSCKLVYSKNGTSSKHRAYLDCIVLNVRRFLKMSGAYMFFRDPESVGENQVAHFSVENANSRTVVFDVTTPQEMVQVNGTLSGTTYSFNASASTLREYVCASLDGVFPSPKVEGDVSNQNVHARRGVDMVVISPEVFRTYADKLAQAHRGHDGLDVLVVTPEQVYNEFSSGTPDATAYRRLMKYFYDNASSEEELPKYLLLFGDGVYDNRQISTAFSESSSKADKVLTYESVESLNATSSYVTDDYFGFLDDGEGANLAYAKLDIGIGRFPVSSVEQAKNTVNKTISYMENAPQGVWKNRLLFLADDGNEYLHEYQADSLARTVAVQHPEFMVHKIYIDAYPKTTTTSGITVPDANNRFSELLNAGLLMVNYTGHGSTTQWADEKLLMLSDVKAMKNKCLPLWVTATCDFCRFDASETSAGEEVFLNAEGGGVALFTTTRVVYAASNFLLNRSFIANIFSRNNGKSYSLGEIMNRSKCSESLKGDYNKLSFTLIGDPALRLACPTYSAEVDSINGVEVSTAVDTFPVLSKVTVSGKVFREDGSLASDYNGLVFPTVFDAEEYFMSYLKGNKTVTYYDRSKVLFSGKDSVINGHFDFSFVVPKDISYMGESGLINFYAYDESGQKEAQGVFDRFVLDGTAPFTVNESGPQMDLYLNDGDFVSGGGVNETPTLIALISDEDGLNTSGSGIGHDLMLTIDGSNSMRYNLNAYFSADVGSYSSGKVQYVLPELMSGKHFLSLKAWDVQNNSNVDTIWFEVKPGMSPSVKDLTYVQQGESAFFVFRHDRPEVNVQVGLYVYDVLGREVWNMAWVMQTGETVSAPQEWSLTDKQGRRILNGIYICKVQLTDVNGGRTAGMKKIRVAAQ